MNIIITGGCGFIGKYLVELLYKDSRINLIYVIDININNKLTNYDNTKLKYITESSKLIKTLDKLNIAFDIIFHLGEFSRINASFTLIENVIDTNIIGTMTILEYARKHNCFLVYSASSSVHQMKENEANPYTIGKKHNIEWIKYYHKWFNLSYCLLYFYNVYGDGQIKAGSMSTVIGKFLEQWLNDKMITVVSPGTQKRSFTHINDTISAIDIILNKMVFPKIMNKENNQENNQENNSTSLEYNISSGIEYSILDVAKMFGDNYIIVKKDKVNRMSSIGDNSKLLELGWEPKIMLKNYIENYVKYSISL